MTLEEIVAERYKGFIELEEVPNSIAQKYQCSLEDASLILKEALYSAHMRQEAPNLYEQGKLGPRLSSEQALPEIHLLMSKNYTNRSTSHDPHLPSGHLFLCEEIYEALKRAGFPIDEPFSFGEEPEIGGNRFDQPSEYVAELEARLADTERELEKANAEIERLAEHVPPYPTKWTKLISEVQRKYWSKYDPKSGAGRPKQVIIVDELMYKHDLPKTTAQAAELIACPIPRKKPSKA